MTQNLKINESMQAFEQSLRDRGFDVPSIEPRKPNGDPAVTNLGVAGMYQPPSDAELTARIARLKKENQ